MRNSMRTRLAATAFLAAVTLTARAGEQAAPPQRNLWAVVIGVEKYDDPRIPTATAAAADSRAISDWLRASLPEGWGLRGLFQAVDGGQAELANPTDEAIRARPTRENLTVQLNRWLRDRIAPGAVRPRPDDTRDVVLIYFAGQAIGLPPEKGTVPEIERHLLLPCDARPDNWSETSLALDDLLAPSPDNPLRDCVVLCWLDTSLLGRGQTPAAWRRTFRPDSRLFLTRLIAWPGRSVWLAADGRPSGLTSDHKGGLFTRALLEALGSPGKELDGSGDLLTTLDRLRKNRALEAQGFLAMGALPPGLAPRQAGLGPLPQVRDQLVLQQGHSQAVRHFALTADEQTLMTGSDDSTIRLWKLGTHEVFRTFADQFDGVAALAIDPGGRYLLSGDGVGNIRGYNVARLSAMSLASQQFRHVNGIAQIARLPGGKSPRFVSIDRINIEGDRPATGGQLLVWRLRDEDTLEAQPFSTERNPPKISRIAVLDDPDAKACLLTLDDRGRLQAYDAQLQPVGAPRTAGRALDIVGIALEPGGSRAVVITDRGRLRRFDLTADPSQKPTTTDLGVPVKNDGLRVGPDRLSVVLTLIDEALIVPIDHPDDRHKIPAAAVQAAWSETGRWLATAGAQGPPRLWKIDPRGEPTEVAIDLPNDLPSPRNITALAIARGRLIASDGLGGVLAWSLPGDDDAGPAPFRQALDPSRGRIQRVRADRLGNRLIAQTADGYCWIWDLKANDGPRTLASRIQGMDILGDGRGVAICREGGQGRGGRIALLDWNGKDLGITLELPAHEGELGLNDVAASPDGRWIAGILKGNLVAPQVILWDLRANNPGQPAATIDDHPDAVTRAVFSTDSRRLLTIDLGGNALVRNLDDPGAPAPPGARFEFGKADIAAGPFGKIDHEVHLTAAAFDPDDPSRFVVGSARGELIACQTGPTIQDRRFSWFGFGREPRATTDLAFVRRPDGRRWLGASFAEVALKLWKADRDQFEAEPLPIGSWRHDEQINSLMTWPVADVPMLVSGGNDGAVRFWGVQGPAPESRPLIGTLAVWPRESIAARDWIAYTPGGEFDGTPGGVQFLRRIGNRVHTLDQQNLEAARIQNLVELFAAGKTPEHRPIGANLPRPPVLSIAEQSRPNARNAYLTIRYEPNVADLRLYQNNIPVPITSANRRLIDRPDESGQVTARVILRPGLNQFYAMAASTNPDALEGRSDPIELRSEIREEDPSLHVLALGVGNYARRKLRFATRDAADLADHLRNLVQAGDQQLGMMDVLLDDQVNERNLREWFLRVRRTVQDRPQDKVVVYLAGHTEVTEKSRRFALLPVDYEFADDWPTVVAMRGLGNQPIPANLESRVLMFSTILAQLVSIEARERLVIIDACQAEAIFSDPAVAQIRRVVDLESWKGRVAYLLATRRGEAALEERKLEHGLMTYILLRGTGAQVIKPPEADPIFAGDETADINRDRVISVPELQAYVKRKLPLLLEQFGGDRERGEGASTKPPTKPRSETRLPVDDFPLIRLPDLDPAPAPARP